MSTSPGTLPASAMGLRRRWREVALTPARNGFLKELRAAGRERASLSLGIFSSTTWRPLASFLEGELLIEGIRPTLEFFEYEGMEAAIAAGGPRFDAVVLAADDPAGYGPLFDSARPFREEDREDLKQHLCDRARRLHERTSRLTVLLPPAPPRLPEQLCRVPEGGTLAGRVARFRVELEAAMGDRARLLDPAAALLDLGAAAYDPRLFELGRIRYSEAGFLALARALAPAFLLQAGSGLKAVVVDLDNTLWGGVLGEAGAAGIALGDSYPGAAFRALQLELGRWREAGLLLAVASKNDLGEVIEVLEGHPAMALRPPDFDWLEVHWEPKSKSVERILERFRIGADAVLFIDDNPRERAEVEDAFPEIRVLDLPEDPLGYADALRSIPWPLFAATAEEDRRRGELERQSQARRSAESEAVSREAYLRSLEIEIELAVDREADAPRVAQLHQKTNQFNLDPKRLGEEEIREAMADARRRVLSIRYRDRFGDAGLVGTAVVRLSTGAVQVETFLVSCRVLGLGIEEALLAAAAAQGVAGIEVRLPYRETARNGPARAFADRLGTPDRERGELLVPAERIPARPAWVRLAGPAAPEREEEVEELAHAT